jgi:ketosteroid isomerase-like protein
MNMRILNTALLGSALALAFSAGANAGGSMAMQSFAGGRSSDTLVVALGPDASAAASTDRESIRAAIKANVRDIVSGINTHNAALATKHDAPNVLVLESGQPNTTGVATDLAGFKRGFAAAPTWRVSLVEETVDVPASGDMAVYRSVYNQDSMHDKVPFTQKVNFISGWSRHENGTWLMDWYAVSEMEKSHKK